MHHNKFEYLRIGGAGAARARRSSRLFRPAAAAPARMAPKRVSAVTEPAVGVAQAAQAAGSSFYAGMRILPKPQRAAMYAVYAFCRAVDDVADEGGTREERSAGLAALALGHRRALCRPADATTRRRFSRAGAPLRPRPRRTSSR